MMFRLFRSCSSLLIFALLISCGFHVRQYRPLAESLHHLQVHQTSRDTIFKARLANALGAHGIIIDNKDLTSINLEISGVRLAESQISIGSTTQVQQKQITFHLAFSLIAPDGTVLVPPQSIVALRSYNVDTNLMLANDSEKAIITSELYQEAINKLLLRLRSPIIAEAVSKRKKV